MPLIIGRGINDVAIVTLTLAPKPAAAARWNDNGLYQVAQELQHELIKVDECRAHLHRRRQPEPDPGRARSRATGALRHHSQPARRQARKRQPLFPGRRVRPARPERAGRRRPNAAGRARYRAAAAHRRATAGRSMSRMSPTSWSAPRARSSRLDPDAHRRGVLCSSCPAVTIAFAKRKGANAVIVADQLLQRLKDVEGRLVPSDVVG